MKNRAWAIETGWTWTGGSSTSKDTWTEIWEGGEGVAVKDAAVVDSWSNYSENGWNNKCDIRKVLHTLRDIFFIFSFNYKILKF